MGIELFGQKCQKEDSRGCFLTAKQFERKFAHYHVDDSLNSSFSSKCTISDTDDETMGLPDYSDLEDDMNTLPPNSSSNDYKRRFYCASSTLPRSGTSSSDTSVATITSWERKQRDKIEDVGEEEEEDGGEEEEEDCCFEHHYDEDFHFSDLSHLNKSFDWFNWATGVIVELIRNPSSQKVVCYKIWPFCMGQTCVSEIFLESNKVHQLGDWIKFERKDLFSGEIDLETYVCQEQMFRTVPAMGKICMECQIVIQLDRRREISTKWSRWLSDVQFANHMTKTPFIRRIIDEHALVQDEDLGTTRWASVEYMRVEDESGEKVGRWRLVFIRPQNYGEYPQKTR